MLVVVDYARELFVLLFGIASYYVYIISLVLSRFYKLCEKNID